MCDCALDTSSLALTGGAGNTASTVDPDVEQILAEVRAKTGRDLTMFADRFVITCPAVSPTDHCHEGLANTGSTPRQLYDGLGHPTVILAPGQIAIRRDRMVPAVIIHEALHLEGVIPFDLTLVSYSGTNKNGRTRTLTPPDPSGLRAGIPRFELVTDCETRKLTRSGPFHYWSAARDARARLVKQGYKVAASVC